MYHDTDLVQIKREGNSMLTVFVVEDEQFARQELIYLLTETGKVKIVGQAEHMHEALWEINEKKPDAVFLDIELAKGNGIELARQFRNMKNQPLIVFATAYDQYALDAFELDAVDYLVKPIDEHRLRKAVDKLLKQTSKLSTHTDRENPHQEAKTLSVRDEDKMIILQADEIYYVGTEDRQAFIKTHDHKYETDTLLYKIMEKLGEDFIQVHRGYIVNLKKISAVEPWFNRTFLLILKDGSKVPVSRSHAKKLRQVLGL